MGRAGWFFFGEADSIIIKDIAKEHKFDVEVVKKHYEKMLKEIEDELHSEKKD